MTWIEASGIKQISCGHVSRKSARQKKRYKKRVASLMLHLYLRRSARSSQELHSDEPYIGDQYVTKGDSERQNLSAFGMAKIGY